MTDVNGVTLMDFAGKLPVDDKEVLNTALTALANAVPNAVTNLFPLDVASEFYFMWGAGAPTSGTSGTGKGTTGKGSMYFDLTGPGIYQNEGTTASPTWVEVSMT